MVKGSSVPPDSVVLTPDEAAELSDRVYQVRCAAEDVSTAVAEGADADELRGLCERKTAQARAELAQYEALLATVQAQGADADTPMPAGFFDAAPAPGGNELADASGATGSRYGRHLERSVLDMVQEQSRRLQAMSDELATVRASLNERKVVERAKGLLMAHRRLSEEEAHKMLRQTAMNQNRKIGDIAQSLVTAVDLLGPGDVS